MSTITEIEWTDATWNPTTGCSRVSEGCRFCYAERFAHRFSGEGQRYEGLTHISNGRPTWTGAIQFKEKVLLLPLSWKSPKRVFVNSMSDLFHENVTDEMRDRIFAVMALTPRHTYQVLTKRPGRMLEYLSAVSRPAIVRSWADEIKGGWPSQTREWPYQNVWLGVSTEDQKTANERIPLLLQTPAAVRFLSCEPLLGPIEINSHRFPALWTEHLDWVIVGGESGPGARRCDQDWIESLIYQCAGSGVSCFVKQLGSQHAAPGDSKGGDMFWWPEHLRVRQFPAEVR